jgi:hypothetical protein
MPHHNGPVLTPGRARGHPREEPYTIYYRYGIPTDPEHFHHD